MKKIVAFSLSILLLLELSAWGKKTHIVFPFAASDVTKIEAIYKDGESEAKEKTIIDEEEINHVYKVFSEIPVKEKQSSYTDPLGTVMFAFYLKDESIYKINYLSFAVKNGSVLSEDVGFDYFTSGDLVGLWESISGKSEVVSS